MTAFARYWQRSMRAVDWLTGPGALRSGWQRRALCESWGRHSAVAAQFCADSERTFLDIGTVLSELAASTRETFSVAGNLVSWSQGRLTDGMARPARDSIAEALGVLQNSESEFERLLGDLSSAVESTRRLLRGHEAVEQSALHLRHATLYMNVHCAGLDAETISGIRSLGATLDGLLGKLLGACKEHWTRLESIRLEAETTAAATRRALVKTRAARKMVAAGLASLDSTPEPVKLLEARAAAAATSHPAALGRIVMALQCHDSVRQRLEHVSAAVAECLQDRSRNPEIERGSVWLVQSRQVESTLEDLRRAEQLLSAELARVAHEAYFVATAALELQARTRRAGDCDLVTALSADLEAVREHIAQTVNLTRSLGDWAKPLAATIASFRAVIESVGFELRIAALNVQLLAARTGVAGAATAVAADDAAAYCGRTVAAAEALFEGFDSVVADASTVLDEIARLGERLSKAQAGLEADAADLPAQMSLARERLEQATQAVISQCELVRSRVSEVLRRADFSETARQRLWGMQEFLNRLAPEADRQPAAPDEALQELASGYTMAREREVHAEAAGIALREEAPPLAPASALGDGDLGNNVELF